MSSNRELSGMAFDPELTPGARNAGRNSPANKVGMTRISSGISGPDHSLESEEDCRYFGKY